MTTQLSNEEAKELLRFVESVSVSTLKGNPTLNRAVQKLLTASAKVVIDAPIEVAAGYTEPGWSRKIRLYTPNKIDAIRIARHVYHIGLKEAKDYVDANWGGDSVLLQFGVPVNQKEVDRIVNSQPNCWTEIE